MKMNVDYPPHYKSTTQFGYNNLGEIMASQIKQARVFAGMTQADLAKKLGTQQSSIARAERTKDLSVNYFLRILKACGCDVQFHISVVKEVS